MTGATRAGWVGVVLWMAGALLVGGLSFGVVVAVFGCGWWREAAAGCLLALLNAGAAHVINRFSVRPPGQKSPLKGLLINMVRFLVVLGLMVVAFSVLGRQGFRPFLLAMFTGYFVFLSAEIARLHRSVAKGSAHHE